MRYWSSRRFRRGVLLGVFMGVSTSSVGIWAAENCFPEVTKKVRRAVSVKKDRPPNPAPIVTMVTPRDFDNGGAIVLLGEADVLTTDVTQIPEPKTLALFAVGLLGIYLARRK